MAKKRRVKHIVMHKRPTPSKLEELVDNLFKRLDVQEERLKQYVVRTESRMQAEYLQIQELLTSFDGIDNNVMVTVGIVKEALGQLTSLDHQLKLLDPKVDGKTLEERLDVSAVVEQAKAWFRELEVQGFQELNRQKKERREKKEQEEAEKKEKAAVQAMLTEPDGGSVIAPTPEGPGSEFPEGAQIFGG